MITLDSSNITLNNILQDNTLNHKSEESIKNADILLIKTGDYFFPDPRPFFLYSKESKPDLKIAISANEDNIPIIYADVYSLDFIVLPTIFLVNQALLSFVTSLIANYVYDKIDIKGKWGDNVRVTIIIQDDVKGTSKSIHYEGSAKYLTDLEKIIINENNDFEENGNNS